MVYRVEIEVTHACMQQLLLSAMTGIRYWCSDFDGRIRAELDSGWSARLTLRDPYKGAEAWSMSLASLKRGIALAASQAPKAFAGLMSGAIDSEQADVIMQLAVFGEIVYG